MLLFPKSVQQPLGLSGILETRKMWFVQLKHVRKRTREPKEIIDLPQKN